MATTLCKGTKKVARGWKPARFGGGMLRTYGKAPCKNKAHHADGLCSAHHRKMVEDLAIQFSCWVRNALSTQELHCVIALNHREQDSKVCHTHDYLDANMVMGKAFRYIYGKEVNADLEAHTDLWNGAWALAKAKEFYAGGR